MADGDSLTYGYKGTQPYPNLVAQNLGSNTQKAIAYNYGVPGDTVQMMLNHQQYVIANYDLSYKRNILAIWGGINDLMWSESSPAQILSLLQTYWQNARNAGFKVLAFTITPSSYAGIAADFESRRQNLNTLIRLSGANYDALADLAADSRIGQAGDELNQAYFYTDRCHLVDSGFEIVASIAEAAITPLLA